MGYYCEVLFWSIFVRSASGIFFFILDAVNQDRSNVLPCSPSSFHPDVGTPQEFSRKPAVLYVGSCRKMSVLLASAAHHERCVLLGGQTCASCGISSLTRDPCPLAPRSMLPPGPGRTSVVSAGHAGSRKTAAAARVHRECCRPLPPPRPPRPMPTRGTPFELSGTGY